MVIVDGVTSRDAAFATPPSPLPKSAVRFTLDANGKVIDVNRRAKSLMETFRNVHLNGVDRDPKTGYVKQL